jgi:hypothetical protein
VSAAFTATVVHGGNNNACNLTFSVSPSPVTAGTTTSFSLTNPVTMTNIDVANTLTIQTTNGQTLPGSYPFTVTVTRGANCQGNGNLTTTGTLAVAGSATHLSISGFPSSVTAGTAGDFTVTALDANNNTAVGFTGTVNFSSSDSQATFSPSSYTFVTGDKGTHTFANGATLRTAGTQSITAAASGLASGTQSGITVNAGATAQLTVTGYPSPVTAGIFNSFTVTARRLIR